MSKLSDFDYLNLQILLVNFGVPDEVIKSELPTKSTVLHKYFLQRKDFRLDSKHGVFILPFSSVKTDMEFFNQSSPKKSSPPVDKLSSVKELLKSSENLPTDKELQDDLKIRKGRGKSKKPILIRTSLTCLVDSSDIHILEKLASTKDVSVSHLVRSAIKFYLKNGEKID